MPDPSRQRVHDHIRQTIDERDITSTQSELTNVRWQPPVFWAKIVSYDGLVGGTQRYTIAPLKWETKGTSVETISLVGVGDETVSTVADDTHVIVCRDPLRIIGTVAGAHGGGGGSCASCCESRYEVLASDT